MATVTILVPTRNRPAPLRRALESLGGLELPAHVRVDVLVVDNSEDGSAAPVVAAVDLPFPSRVIAERRPGVATARNRGIAEATGEMVAFLDDDCEASPAWLAAQLATLAATGADGSFGPRVAAIEGPEPPDAAFFKETYSRDLAEPDGTDVSARHAYLPLPGAVLVRARCLADPTPFDARLDHIGGEDVLLFRRLVDRGCRFVWSPRAVVTEHIPALRLDMGFVMRRRYLSGQHRCIVPMLMEPPRRSETALHMAKGAAATLLSAPVALGGRLLARRWPPVATGLLMSGLGKLTWWRGDRPALYGSGHR